MANNLLDLGLFIPTLNAGKEVSRIVNAIRLSGLPLENVLIIDSESIDNTVRDFRNAGIHTESIAKDAFAHGKVRQLALEYFHKNVAYLMVATQDVIFGPESIKNLYAGLIANPTAGLAYARQISGRPHSVEYYDKLFCYPPESRLKKYSERNLMGSELFFNSDAFAIYRVDALQEIGGFPVEVHFSEDAYVAGKLLLAGYDNYYDASSIVTHDNNLGYHDLFVRYRSIARFYKEQNWLTESFGGNETKGKRLVMFELHHALRMKSLPMFVQIILTSGIKYLAYKMPISGC